MRLILSVPAIVCAACLLSAQEAGRGVPAAVPAPRAMTLTIPGFPDGGPIPVKFSQAAPGVAPGEGLSPAMTWANAPAGTQSFFLHMHDLDLARNKTTDDQAHWVLWNLPAATTGLPEGVPKGSPLPDGSFQISATGPMYRGPGAAASGPLHHYVSSSLRSISSWT
jgi:phosphatidylethanolamine-binding protein (PEBP) family uncharacterized protein